jgi:hypothetical protein
VKHTQLILFLLPRVPHQTVLSGIRGAYESRGVARTRCDAALRDPFRGDSAILS